VNCDGFHADNECNYNLLVLFTLLVTFSMTFLHAELSTCGTLPTKVCFNSLASFKHSLKNVDFSMYLKCY